MKVKVINKGIEQETFNNCKDKVSNMVLDISKKLDIDTYIIVHICKEPDIRTIDGCCHSMKNKHIIYLYQHLLEREDDSLELVILHELVHAKDAYYVNKNNRSFLK